MGLKPISAIVDITNYIMFDLNRPLHAYDADKINKEIIVRNSKKDESFEALDNKKYTLDNNMTGFDHKMSLNPIDFIAMVKGIRDIERIKGTGEKNVSETEWITRNKYHVSIASANKIVSGTLLTDAMIVYRNPGTGIPAKDAHRILGKKALRDIPADELLRFEMFE